jgi:polyhydroxyalkanoate synthesis regulator phasin
MAKLIDEIARQSALTDEKLDHADLCVQQARIVAELAYMAAVQCQTVDTLVARIEALEKKVKKLQKSDEPHK